MANELIQKTLGMKSWAVVGANQDPAKYGHRIYHVLRDRGYRVYPVNPEYEEINGEKCYASVLDLPEAPDVIDMVVNPFTGIHVIKEIARIGTKYVWMQPGTRSDKIRDSAKENGGELIEDCVLVRVDQ